MPDEDFLRALAASRGHASAMAEFTAEDPIELSFKQDERLEILPVETPEGWLMGRNMSGQQGLVPESYVQPLLPPGEEGEDEADDAYDDEIRDTGSMFSGFKTVGQGRMLADFVAEADGEMSCSAGDEITLLLPEQGLPEGWLYGRMPGAEGLIPETYVEVRRVRQAQRAHS